MNTMQQTIHQEINTLPLMSQKEVLDFVLFLKKKLISKPIAHTAQ